MPIKECIAHITVGSSFMIDDCTINIGEGSLLHEVYAAQSAGNWTNLTFSSFGCNGNVTRVEPVDCSGTATRNSPEVELFMALWAAQCILMWSTAFRFVSRSESVGPTLKVMTMMFSDLAIWVFVAALTVVAEAFMIYYILAGDVADAADGDEVKNL